MLNSITNYFITQSADTASAGDLYRARILVSSSFSTAFMLLPFTIAWGFWGEFASKQFVFITLVECTLFITPFIYRLTNSVALAGIFVNLLSASLIMVFTYFDGGITSTAIPWYPVLPLFGVFYSGKAYGFSIAFILSAFILILIYLHSENLVPGTSLSPFMFNVFYAGSTISAMIILIVVSLHYLAWQDSIREELLMANKAKSEFLSGVSHELRTPLNSILGFSEVLDKKYVGELNEQQGKFVNHIHSSGEHLLQLVNNLLDISKIESGKLEFSLSLTNVQAIINDCTAMVSKSAEKKSIALNVNVAQELQSTSVELDELKIKQVVLNLLSNAIKFTPDQGQVSIEASIDNEILAIVVNDNGPGIPEHKTETVFERFYQVHHKDTHKDPGTGLGLAICRHFVELHGGKISLKNLKKGASFICEFPIHRDGLARNSFSKATA